MIAASLLPVFYVASFGPACWLTSRANVGTSAIPVLYRPLTWVMSPKRDATFTRMSSWYAQIGAPANWEWFCGLDIEQQLDGTFVEHPGNWYWVSGNSRLPFSVDPYSVDPDER
ncbi:MAG TPA: hypothetical protein VGM05_16960 [Planctomycetaceae bacterium]|jgi:hypothetical protein